VTAVNVAVYSDSALTQTCILIDWGLVLPGDQTDKTIYVKNNGNVPATLKMTTTNWEPQYANQYITLTWKQENYTLNPNDVVPAELTFTLSLLTENITNFAFTTIITGTEA
jgi:hypothetical protein